MIGALIYLQAQSVKNRLRTRLRRLKKPKYLAGAIVGGLYFYFFSSVTSSRAGRRPGRPWARQLPKHCFYTNSSARSFCS